MPDFTQANPRIIYAYQWAPIYQDSPSVLGPLNGNIGMSYHNDGTTTTGSVGLIVKFPRCARITTSSAPGSAAFFFGEYIDDSDYALSVSVSGGDIGSSAGVRINGDIIVEPFSIEDTNWGNLVDSPAFSVSGQLREIVFSANRAGSAFPLGSISYKKKAGLSILAKNASGSGIKDCYGIAFYFIRTGSSTSAIDVELQLQVGGIFNPHLVLPSDYSY